MPALLALYRHLHPADPALTPDDAVAIWRQQRLYRGSEVFVGVADGNVVATCTLVVIPNLTRGGMPYGLIENVVTAPAHRRRGHGQAVLRHAVESAWRAGCFKVMLMTGAKDPATLRFYENAGFEQSKTGFQVRRVAVRED